MTRTLQTWYRWSSVHLVRGSWVGAAGEDAWALLARVLHALVATQTVLESLSGRINVFWQDGSARRSAIWPIEDLPGGLDVLRERVRAAGDACQPFSAVLCCDADVVLPDDVDRVEVADWEGDDQRESVVAMPLEHRDHPDLPGGLRIWKALCARDIAGAIEEDAPVYLDIGCEGDVQPPRLWIDAHSRYELWRPWTIDGEGPVPGGRRSVERVRDALEAVAAATGGVVSLPSGMVADLARVSGVR